MLRVESKKSLYEPLEVLLDGETYSAPEVMDSDFITKASELQIQAVGDITKLRDVVQFVFGIPGEVLKKIDVRVLAEINQYFVDSLMKPEKVQASGNVKKKNG